MPQMKSLEKTLEGRTPLHIKGQVLGYRGTHHECVPHPCGAQSNGTDRQEHA